MRWKTKLEGPEEKQRNLGEYLGREGVYFLHRGQGGQAIFSFNNSISRGYISGQKPAGLYKLHPADEGTFGEAQELGLSDLVKIATGEEYFLLPATVSRGAARRFHANQNDESSARKYFRHGYVHQSTFTPASKQRTERVNVRRIHRPPRNRNEGTPTTRIIRSTSKRERSGMAQPKAQQRPSVISRKPGTPIATIVAEPTTNPEASTIKIDTIATNTGETDATTHD